MNQYDVDDYVLPRRRSPWVLVGAGSTAAILLGGLLAFRRGNQNLSQKMMRARVVAQGATVAIMAGTAGAASLSASPETDSVVPAKKPDMQ
ncbi:RING-H2 finger protein atl48 [Trebouxia sp. C0009 RCD-2024]